jgi:hypothetical protein
VPAEFGIVKNGVTIALEVAGRLPLPPRADFVAHAECVLAEADRVLALVDDAAFGRVVTGWGGEPMVIGLLAADTLEPPSGHVGKVEAPKDVQGQAGTATI